MEAFGVIDAPSVSEHGVLSNVICQSVLHPTPRATTGRRGIHPPAMLNLHVVVGGHSSAAHHDRELLWDAGEMAEDRRLALAQLLRSYQRLLGVEARAKKTRVRVDALLSFSQSFSQLNFGNWV